MSLYLSEWKFGYEIFRDFAELAWNPLIECELNADFSGDKYKVSVSFLDVDLVNSLADRLEPDDLKKEFIGRFNIITDKLFDLLRIKDFISVNYNYAMKTTGGDLDQANKVVNLAFQQHIMEFEFWNKRPLTELYANLLFYGTISDPGSVFFVIPPMNEWDSVYRFGWPGYPFNRDSDKEN